MVWLLIVLCCDFVVMCGVIFKLWYFFIKLKVLYFFLVLIFWFGCIVWVVSKFNFVFYFWCVLVLVILVFIIRLLWFFVNRWFIWYSFDFLFLFLWNSWVFGFVVEVWVVFVCFWLWKFLLLLFCGLFFGLNDFIEV